MTKDNNTRRADNFGEEQHDGLKDGNVTRFESDTCIDSSTRNTDQDRLAKALRWLSYARDWRIENQSAWAAFEAYADSCITEDKTLSGNALHAIIKRHDYVNTRTGKTTGLNRTVLPLFSRWLLCERPSLKVELRRSFFDVLFPKEEGDNA